ncbi:Protein phosphatase 2C (PP2C)-like domain [Pseudocohnilembus persalinus]|uniref:Protein phosphatase 2C (PP2C)-like domain n=1 Tax=Pseudocohnilembus persalinus TaxID=266149 RepID=A0A0V0R2V1_PSEPJ|nr:Protein phosphatase 2C (PP2C)-like domain [Pseudocohnilembus persalinus]|eukprot:KRX08733.1 Protein phosphatase 2C (PP2C)-like domain [Pseudocohnilembus persalinus]
MEENKMQLEIKFAVKSRAGQHSQSIRKINQDSYIAVTKFMGDQQGFLFGIFDGHGQNGSLVSSFVKKVIHKNISQQIINTYGQQVKWNSANFQPSQLLVDSFINVHEDLKKTCTDIKFSGTTAVVIMIKNTQLWCANCGDSRAVMYSYQNGYKSKLNQQNNKPIITQLSEDHKPSLQREKIRIQQSGGQILKSKNRNGQEIGIERVYKLNSETPGLAMTRSIGDLDGKEAGVIPDCEVQKFSINQNSQFIVIGSDGIWEFLSNQEVYDIVNPLYQQNINPKQVSEILVENAVQSWKKHDYQNIDDITCIIIYLNLKQTQKIQNTSFSIDSDESPRLQQFD